MPTDHLIVLSVPGLRPDDVGKSTTPTLYGWAAAGAIAEIVPTFPCTTSPVQASMFTGAPPAVHGIISNGFYWRDRGAVEFWVGTNELVGGEPVWDALRRARPGMTTAVWHAQNIKQANADFIVTPAPIHEPDGTTKLWCYSKPDDLYESMLRDLNHFPLQHYWGPLANIESTRWILRAASWLIDRYAPNLHWIYVPHLDYASQKHGPDSEQARSAIVELDVELAAFARSVAQSHVADDVTYLVVGEYAMTNVSGVVYPNRLLRDAGLLCIRREGGAEQIDFAASTAVAVVDHQVAHIYVKDGKQGDVAKCRALFDGSSGVAGVFAGEARARIGLGHERSGDIILAATDTHWFAYYWWFENEAAPAFARTVDIHRKPGYDPVELFVDAKSKSIPLDTSLICGSHGAPATRPCQRAALICSTHHDVLRAGHACTDTQVKEIMLKLLGAA